MGRKRRSAPAKKGRLRAKTLAKNKAEARRNARKITARRRVELKDAEQIFNVSHRGEDDFDGGSRRYAKYRDLGRSKATNGMVQAHVIRMIPPCDPEEVSKRHYLDVDLRMVYVLRGWIKSEFEGEGEVTMREGSCWLRPPRIKHSVLDYSEDRELPEIILPANCQTVTLE